VVHHRSAAFPRAATSLVLVIFFVFASNDLNPGVFYSERLDGVAAEDIPLYMESIVIDAIGQFGTNSGFP
jgi:hypothetical protein